MKKLIMLLCTLCLAVPMFAQELTDTQLSGLPIPMFAQELTDTQLSGLPIPRPTPTQVFTDDPAKPLDMTALVAPEAADALPNEYEHFRQLDSYILTEVTQNIDESTSLRRVTHLMVAGDFLYSGEIKDFFYALISSKVQNKTEKEKAALYSLMKFSNREKEMKVRINLFGSEDVIEPLNEDKEFGEVVGAFGEFMHYMIYNTRTHESEEKIQLIFSFLQETK